MQVASSTASCGLAPVPSPRSMPLVPLTVHNPTASTRQGRSSESPSANFVNHGFLRAADGTFTAFDPLGSTAPFGTTAVGINPAGSIVGGYFDGITFHGFLRAADGTFTTVDPPGSAASSPGGINPAGGIAGSYFDASGAAHGFLLRPKHDED